MNDPLTLGYIFSGTALGLLLLISIFFYRLGYWRASGVRGPRFDRLAPALQLNQTTWRAEFSSFGQRMDDEAHVVTLTFRQSGSRLAAEGLDESGRRWSLEGVVFQRHITFLTLERSTAGHALGSGHLDAAEPHQMVGTHSSTSRVAGCVLVRTLRLHQVLPESEDSVAETNADESVDMMPPVHS